MANNKMVGVSLPLPAIEELQRQSRFYGLTVSAYIRLLIIFAHDNDLQLDGLTQTLRIPQTPNP